MRALVISGAGRHALLDHDLPPAGPGDLLLAPLAVGLCATDLELLDGSMVYLRDGRAHLPLVPGHEWVARVVDPGRRAAGSPWTTSWWGSAASAAATARCAPRAPTTSARGGRRPA